MTAPERSPFAPGRIDDLPPLKGVRLAAVEAGLRYRDRPDLLLMAFEGGAEIAGVLTRSRCPSAPVEWCRKRLSAGRAAALVVNAGNANAFTGLRGREACRRTAEAAAAALGADPERVFLASTGVIGEPLDPEPFEALLADMAGRLRPDGWDRAARAIMTTDTFPKLATRETEIEGSPVRLNGIAKGSGMIAPDMGTMLAFVATDGHVGSQALDGLLRRHADITFNAITVDGDTSTSDTLLAMATGRAGDRPFIGDPDDERLVGFSEALHALLHDLALKVVGDGEGLTKRVKVEVRGAQSDASARRIAHSIANSPLVKTAIAGEDPNWGRVVMAVGKAGEPADRDRLDISFGPHRVARQGERDPGYSEEAVARYMRGAELAITAELGIGEGAAVVWTCDLTHAYVSINADYRS